MNQSVTASCFIVVALIATPLTAQLRLESTPSPVAGIKILLPEAPEFSASVQSLIPANQRAVFEPALPYSVVIVNSSDSALLAFCTRFEVTHESGATRNYVSSFDVLPPIGMLMLPVGARKLITLDRTYTDAVGMIGTPAGGRLDSALDPGVLAKFASARRVVFSLDAALLPDGTFFGADFSNSFDHYSGIVAAHRQFYQGLLQDLNPTPASLLQYAKSQAALHPVPAKAPWQQDMFTITLSNLGAQTIQSLGSGRSIESVLSNARGSLQRANSLFIHK